MNMTRPPPARGDRELPGETDFRGSCKEGDGSMVTSAYEWVSPIGGNWTFWATYQNQVAELVRAQKLTPVTIGALPVKGPAAPAVSERMLIDFGIRGGIRAPHLHLDGSIYLLNDQQWAGFSKGIIDTFTAALKNAKTVGFEQAIVMGSLAATMRG